MASKKKRIMVKAKLDEISAVDKPAMPDAKAVLRKRDENQPSNGPSPAGPAAPTPAGNKSNTMTPEQIEALQKRAERAEKALELSGAEREHYDNLDEAGQTAFLDLNSEGRAAEVAKAEELSKSADPIVYTDGLGQEFRKSDDPRLVAMAKDADASRKKAEKSEELAKAARVNKRASDLNHLPGDLTDRVLLVEAVEKMDSDQQDKLNELLDKLNTNLAKAFTRAGTTENPNSDGDSTEAKIEALVKKFQEADTSLTRAQAYSKALNSDEGKKLYSEHLSAR